ncbi:hypothetical protein AUEXF2481DRAFT_2611 [Aureobasidium subglaciale EXF-2481]|uniref:Uncharacterized protein n=1 Tax=Aureobasidium subglaciale (strain EXF-2481) TaxID=1043005 RepID=A0A074YIS6_AURSE|nr:uncharacterized protein AUEXF2481DRAFT_2611 [Aureobasidium subglaciale EXF-2481]KEQ97678.1 hypothetical protein AUEXF2481DRAFT_2611 [Aureobasidium subglaciale EXF-2481]
MPRTFTRATIAESSTTQQTFIFPKDSHLIITTSGGIFSWDHDGVKRLFSSSKKGILAAREAKDGSQMLAVADEHVVVLHDCKRGREESWGLSGNEGIVRLLEYGPDAKSLFLSTSLTGAIQHYSIRESKLLDSPSSHPSAPTVLAVSPTSHLILSASENPTVVYLRNLTLRTSAIQLHPSASSAAIAAASFHPGRPNVFLLAFKDGSIAAYDATKIARNKVGAPNKSCMSTNGHTGEISHFKNLHRITNVRNMSDPPDASTNTTIGSKSIAITGAAFLPGFMTRAVSVGADGRCRLVDFEAGGKILRTWHAQAPVTSLSVLAAKVQPQPVKKIGHRQISGAVEGPIETKTIIAVGRVDGQVLLFDSVGLRLDQVIVNDLGEKIISVDWMRGPSPHAIPNSFQSTSAQKQAHHALSPNNGRSGTIKESSLLKVLKLPSGAVFDPVQVLPEVIVYISETEDVSTVRHTPNTGAVVRSTVAETTYLDLFSPVKKVSPPRARKSPVSSPRLRRSRLSSHTFVKSSSPGSTLRELDPVTESSEYTEHISIKPLNASVASKQTPPPAVAPPASAQRGPRSARKRVHIHATHSQVRSPGSSAVIRRNGKVLADLRKLSTGNSAQSKRGGSAALFAPYMNRTGITNLPRTGTQQLVEDEPKLPRQTQQSEHGHERRRHQTPQERKFECVSESRSSDRDIWLSAGSSDEICNRRDYVRHTYYHARTRQAEQSQVLTQHVQQPQARPRQAGQPHAQLPLAHEASRPKRAPFVPILKPEPAHGATPISPRPQNSGKEAAVLSMSEEAMFSASVSTEFFYLLYLSFSTAVTSKVAEETCAGLEGGRRDDKSDTEFY